MNDWLDDLSEDWPSQPPSETANSLPQDLKSHPESSTRRPNGSTRRKSVLSERSANESNMQSQPGTRGGLGTSARSGLSRRSLSAESNQSIIQYGTTARKSLSASPPKLRNTPEWKRRLLGGDMAYGEQKDLFSDMGIQSIFKPPPPTPAHQTQKETSRGLFFLKSLETVPSSPPVWNPSNAQPRKSEAGFGSTAAENLDALDEIEEDSPQERSSSRQQLENDSVDYSVMQHQPSFRRNPNFSQPTSSLASRPSSLGSVRFHAGSRKASKGISFQSNGDSSDFSPVFISKHNTADGRVDYAALDLSKSELAERLRNLADGRASQQSTNTVKYDESYQVDESSLARLESENLPEDLPVGTPEVASIGEFVSVKRGGYSDIGSFKRRPLSPSPLARPMSTSVTENSEMRNSIYHQSLTDNAFIRPTAPTPPQLPTTPRHTHEDQLLSPRKNKSSNSPLKLFGNHDTFTSNMLQRRISQLEDSIHHTQVHAGSKPGSGLPSRRNTQSRLSSLDEASFQAASQRPAQEPLSSRHPSVEGYFGRGELDEYTFPEDEFSNDSRDQSEFGRSLQSLPSRSPSPDVLPPGSQQQFVFKVVSPEPEVADTFRGKRKLSRVSAKSTISVNKRSVRSNKPTLESVHDQSDLTTVHSISHFSEGKRPPTSPFKNPTPKRRRTLVQVDIDTQVQERTGDVSNASIRTTHQHFQTAIGKRKDARYDSTSNIADPDVLSRRHILRPRNPTPSQRARQEMEDEILDAAAEFASSSPRLQAIKEHLAVPGGGEFELMQARAVASEVAAFSERVAHSMRDDGRKRSVTTQDFLDEAMKIMSFIRNKGRPTSGLGSVVEYDPEQRPDEDDLSFQPCPLSLERPPTREGRKSGWRPREGGEVDASVLDHLQRYQERDDDDFMASSLRSSRFDQEIERVSARIDTIESHPPGIHIIDRSPHLHSPSRSRSNSNRTEDGPCSSGTNGINPQSHSSRTSMNSSLGRTTASRKSDNVATLAPDAVAHLIPEHIAGMVFDKEKGIWVRNRSPKKAQKTIDEPSSLTQSENDPFDDIPDLTVDEAEETKHLLLSKSLGKPDGNQMDAPYSNDHAAQPTFGSDEKQCTDQHDHSLDSNASSPASKVSFHASTSKNTDSITRATSWSHVKGESNSHHDEEEGVRTSVQDSDDHEVEHEIKIHEGRSGTNKRHDLRDITVSISSPMVTREYKGLSPVPESPGVATRDFASKTPQSKSELRKEQDRRQLSVSVRLSRTLSSKKETNSLANIPSSSPCKADLTFYMSELSEFTLHQADERTHPDRVLAKRNQIHAVEDRFSSGNQQLVKALQDVEPDEPFWEELRHVDLHSKDLSSLHLLDLFCERVEKVNISNNKICQLSGAPSTVRCLSVRNNLLTSLTSWGHLRNLQYLDVSGNDIDSLEGFSCLIHLRELRADNNRVASLDGIECLDGLLTLSLRRNQLKRVHFGGYELRRLQALDFKGNELTEVHGLHLLPALTDLNLDENEFEYFPQDDKACKQLKSLSLRENHFSSVELTQFCPRLERLYLDSNSLTSTFGISQLKHLRILSLRSQTPQTGTLDLQPLLNAKLPELHTLSLSETHIPSLSMPRGWTSLRHLNLASCGLQNLPDIFGLSVPNLRSLNLNFNAIRDLRPLLNIGELNAFFVAGNRLSRLRKTAAVLSKLGGLEELDLRDNPFTVGFYRKGVESRVVRTHSSLSSKTSNDGEDNQHQSDGDEAKEEEDAHTLPPSDQTLDKTYFSRLDEGTKLRRRVYEMLIATSCQDLGVLDGKKFEKGDVLVKDEIWERLLLLGVVRRSERGVLGLEGV